jgi:hypothetical protein
MTMTTPITDPKLAAAAPLLGGKLERLDVDSSTGRVTFIFSGLPTDFLEQAFNGGVRVVLKDYIAGLESVQALLAQCRARRKSPA